MTQTEKCSPQGSVLAPILFNIFTMEWIGRQQHRASLYTRMICVWQHRALIEPALTPLSTH